MNLPNTNIAWPPATYAKALDQVRRDHAWITGDLNAIRDQTGGARPQPYTSRAQFNGGIVGATARGVLGRPPVNPRGSTMIERHLPIAAELVGASADLLAEKPPAITLHDDDAPVFNDKGTLVSGNLQAAQSLDELTSTDLFAAEFWGGCWKAAAHGWVFARVVWNQDVQPHPWIQFVDADQGHAEFSNGRQIAITFWDTYRDGKDDRKAYRLLQRHSMGQIEYGLYEGTEDKLGRRVPVTDHPDTAHLADLLDADSTIPTGIGHLTARMIINREPNPAWRHDPVLRYYGHSDISKAGSVWADIDMAWTNFMNDIENGRGRIMVSDQYLESGKPGEGSYFDFFRDVFPLAAGGNADEQGVIKPIQFDMRVLENAAAVDNAVLKAVDAVGLSPITVGKDTQASGTMTATEIRALSAKTIRTVGGKARQVRAGLSELLTAYLHMDALLNNYAPPTRPVNVALVEPVQDTDKDRAERALALRNADAASTRYLVRDLHPEWTPEQVGEEVDEIIREKSAGMPVDPFAVGADQAFGTEEEVPVSTTLTNDEVAKAATAAGVLIRAGFEPNDALRAVRLDPIKHSGLLPTTVKEPERGE